MKQGQVFELRKRAVDGSPVWAYRYRTGGPGSRRLQRGGFSCESDAAEALGRAVHKQTEIDEWFSRAIHRTGSGGECVASYSRTTSGDGPVGACDRGLLIGGGGPPAFYDGS
jgi:hypothetical protein